MPTRSLTHQTRRLTRTVAILMLGIVVAIPSIACGDTDVSKPEPTTQAQTAPTTAPTATSIPTVVAEPDDEHDSDASSGEDDDTVSNTNQIAGGYTFDWSENQAFKDAEPLNIITWESGPTLGLGELYGEATINDDAIPFEPMLGEGAALAIYHVNYDSEPMLVLLPNLGPTMVWETDLTVAEMDYEIDGQTLTFRAYSPLLFDINSADIKLRIYGYDNNAPSLLAISDINPE